jgi:hypothetical protein
MGFLLLPVATLGGLILVIVFIVSEKQAFLEIHAGPDVAVMQHVNTIRDRTFGGGPEKAMSSPSFVLPSDLSVAVRKLATGPQPATICVENHQALDSIGKRQSVKF